MKTIYCSECRTYLGIIRDGKLKKGLAFLCATCEAARKLSKPKKNNIVDFFEDNIFK